MGIAKSTVPDVCKTPSPGGPVPIPYPVIISMSSDLVKGTKTVKVDGGNSAAIKGSEFSRCNGDEPGTAGGVKSSTNMKEATWLLYSFDVKLDGKNACRLSDKMMMNHQNTACLGGVVNPPVPGEGLSPPGDCTQEQYDNLRNEVKESKAEVGKLGACQDGDSPSLLKRKGDVWLRQAVARSRLDQTCFRGGDAGHQEANANCWRHAGRCQKMLKS
jgi:hypothetical protein